MREYSKRNIPIPEHLKSQKVLNSFNENVRDQEHTTGRDYNNEKLKEDLKKIHNNKCIYCEKSLIDTDAEIEHFRPKNSSENNSRTCDKSTSYYWLAYSWDNLLYVCKQCNRNKSNCFDIEGVRLAYSGDSLDSLHDKIEDLNREEMPKCINPEVEVFEKDIIVNFNNGKLESLGNKKFQYTSKVCKLNRDGLLEKRSTCINDFVNKVRVFLSLYIDLSDKNISEVLLFKLFKEVFTELKEKREVSKEFSLVFKKIDENFEQFIIDKDIAHGKLKDELLKAYKLYR